MFLIIKSSLTFDISHQVPDTHRCNCPSLPMAPSHPEWRWRRPSYLWRGSSLRLERGCTACRVKYIWYPKILTRGTYTCFYWIGPPIFGWGVPFSPFWNSKWSKTVPFHPRSSGDELGCGPQNTHQTVPLVGYYTIIHGLKSSSHRPALADAPVDKDILAIAFDEAPSLRQGCWILGAWSH